MTAISDLGIEKHRLKVLARGIILEMQGLTRSGGRPCSAIAREILRSQGLSAPRDRKRLHAEFVKFLEG